MRVLWSLIIVSIVYFFIQTPVFAGGGRYRLESFSSPGYTGSNGIYIQASITTNAQTKASVGEKAEFRIQNPRPGDRCGTTTNITTENGQIFGKCFTTTAGQMLVYVHSFDQNEDSSPYVIYFVEKPTLAPTKIIPTIEYPTETPLPTKTPTQILSTISPSEIVTSPFPQNLPPQKESISSLIIDFIYSIFSSLFKH